MRRPPPEFFYAEIGEEVPSNFEGIPLWPHGAPDLAVQVERWDGTTWVAEEAQVEELGGHPNPHRFVRPSPFQEGDRFRLRAAEDEESLDTTAPPDAEITVVAPVSTSDVDVTAEIGPMETEYLYVATGGCASISWTSTRSIEIAVPASLEPYRNLIFFETIVDGTTYQLGIGDCYRPVPGRPRKPEHGTEILAAWCPDEGESNTTLDTPRGALLEEGTHTVQGRAYIPGTELSWTTEEVEFELLCSGEPDTGNMDGGPGAGDLAGDGCACSTSSSSFGPSLLLLVLFGGLLCRRRFGGS